MKKGEAFASAPKPVRLITMQLSLQRNLEYFFQLCQLPVEEEDGGFYFAVSPARFVLEYTGDRLLLTGMVSISNPKILRRVLQHALPEKTSGVLQRAFLHRGDLVLNCQLPLTDDAHGWLAIFSWQQRTLLTYAGR